METFLYILGSTIFVVYTLFCISLGFWLGQSSFEKGAEISLKAQKLNDDYDVQKFGAITKVVTESIKAARGSNGNGNEANYPPLFDTVDGEAKYLSTGFDEE